MLTQAQEGATSTRRAPRLMIFMEAIMKKNKRVATMIHPQGTPRTFVDTLHVLMMKQEDEAQGVSYLSATSMIVRRSLTYATCAIPEDTRCGIAQIPYATSAITKAITLRHAHMSNAANANATVIPFGSAPHHKPRWSRKMMRKRQVKRPSMGCSLRPRRRVRIPILWSPP